MNTSIFKVGAQVKTIREFPGVTINEMTYGYLPEGKIGTVEEHTADGRAVILFPGYDVHTYALDMERDCLRRVLTDSEKLQRLATFASGILSHCGRLAGSDIRSFAKENELIDDDVDVFDEAIVVLMQEWLMDLIEPDWLQINNR